MPTALAEPLDAVAPAAAPPQSPRLAWLGRIFPLRREDLRLLERLASAPDPGGVIAGPGDPEEAAGLASVQCGIVRIEGERLRLDPRIERYLHGDDALDASLALCVRLPTPPDPHIPSYPEVEHGLVRLARAAEAEGRPLRVRLRGPRGSGRERTALAASAALGIPMLAVDLERLPADTDMAAFARTLLLDAWLRNALIFIGGLESLRAPPRSRDLATLLEAVATDRGVTILAEETDAPEPAIPDLIDVALAIPGTASRRALWSGALATQGLALDEAALAVAAARYRLTPAQIDAAASAARGRLDWARAVGAPLTAPEAVVTGARAQCGQGLAALATKVEARARWEDLVLPEPVVAQLRELCDRVAGRDRVLDDWGFAARLGYGTNPAALLYGASGTGKTMAATAIARVLGLDLYRVNLAGVVSKYIGETEKNLDQIFAAAERSNAILLFDEADALFGKRSEVKDAHDRYANIEISFLLQRMESYDGLALLCTNMKGHLDEGFTRRLAFVVHFPLPDEPSRLALWRRIWPAAAPLGPDLDFEYLARAHRLSGGHIKNAALAAAFTAAADGAPIGMRHVLHAIRREYGKMGKDLDPAELEAAWHAAGSR